MAPRCRRAGSDAGFFGRPNTGTGSADFACRCGGAFLLLRRRASTSRSLHKARSFYLPVKRAAYARKGTLTLARKLEEHRINPAERSQQRGARENA